MKIDPEMSVNDVLRKYPEALDVLNAFTIDTCCRGEEPLSAAAAAANVSLEKLIAAIVETDDAAA